jgi:LacI family transcriptional regulator
MASPLDKRQVLRSGILALATVHLPSASGDETYALLNRPKAIGHEIFGRRHKLLVARVDFDCWRLCSLKWDETKPVDIAEEKKLRHHGSGTGPWLTVFSSCVWNAGAVNLRPMTRRRHVALLIETSNAYSRGLLEGIIAYVREHESWSIFLPEQQRGAKPPAGFDRWRGDGIIARIETDEIARVVLRTRLPVVDVSAARRVETIPWVETNDEMIAQLAVDHLLNRGFKQLAYCGDRRFNWSKWRAAHFARLVKEAGCVAHSYEEYLKSERAPLSPQGEHRYLMSWVRGLPKPVGVMACYDISGQRLLDACRDLDVAVPEQVAVIGVDNDPLICNLSTPPLSSVIPDKFHTGYRAAEILDRMMFGEELGAEAHRIDPLGVETRQSTDVMAIDDSEVALAMRVIREQACKGIKVAQLCRHVSISRRALDERFKKLIGRTPHDEIVRVRLERVKRLLVETDLTMEAISRAAGFAHVEYLSTAFKKHTGIPPSEFRRQGAAARKR